MTQVTETSVWTRKSKRIGGWETYFSFTCNVFSYSKLNSRLKENAFDKKKNHFENVDDFRWIGPLKTFNLRRFFRWALVSREGGRNMTQMPPLPWIRAWIICMYFSTFIQMEIWNCKLPSFWEQWSHAAHVCDQPWLCPNSIVATHNWAGIQLCPDTIICPHKQCTRNPVPHDCP